MTAKGIRGGIMVAGLACSLVLAACSRGSKTSSVTMPTVISVTTTVASTTTTLPGTPRVSTFDVPKSANCRAGMTEAKVSVRYEVAGATAVALQADGAVVPGDRPTSGTTEVEIPCDGKSHKITLQATGPNATVATREAAVAP